MEDHEDILAVHRETKTFSAERARKFIFREDCLKYEFFHDPEVSMKIARLCFIGFAPVRVK